MKLVNKNIPYLLIVILMLNSCSMKNEIQIGEDKSKLKGELSKSSRFALINPGTISDLFYYKRDGINYLLSFNKNNKINYFIVESEDYITPENLQKNDSVKLCLERQGILMVEEGVCFFIILKSGWFAYIEGINFDINKIYDSRVKFFYKKESTDNAFFTTYEEYNNRFLQQSMNVIKEKDPRSSM